MSQWYAWRGVFNLQGDCWCCLWRQGKNSYQKRDIPPQPVPLLISCLLFILVYSLTLESWLHNTSEKHSVFHQPKLHRIPPLCLLVVPAFSFWAGAIWKRGSLQWCLLYCVALPSCHHRYSEHADSGLLWRELKTQIHKKKKKETEPIILLLTVTRSRT